MTRYSMYKTALLTTSLVVLPVASVTTLAAETNDTEAPTAPGSLTANALSSTQVSLVWNASTDSGGGVVAGYDVWRNGAKLSTLTGTSYTDTRAEPGTSYSYRIDAFDNVSPRNKSRKSNSASVTTPASQSTDTTDTTNTTGTSDTINTSDTAAPTAPGNLTANALSSTQVSLAWNASTDSGGGVVAGYDVWRDGAKLSTLTGTSYTDTRAEPGTSYSYRIDAFDDASPRNKSRKSNSASAATPASQSTDTTGTINTTGTNDTTNTSDTAAPTAPGNLTANALSSTQVSLAWDASTDLGGGIVAGYDVWRDGAKLSTLTGTRFTDTRAEPGTLYSYRVDAFDNASPRNKSRKSNRTSVTTPASETNDTADTEAPTAPGNLTANASSTTQVGLAWNASTDLGGGVVAGYDVWRDGAKLSSLTGTSFIDTSVQPGTSYSYQVDAFDNASPKNTSVKSNVAIVITSEMPTPETTEAPTAPQNLTAKAVSPNKANLWWTSSRGAGSAVVAGYEIYRNGSMIAKVTDTSYSDLSVQENTSYNYSVLAFDNAEPAHSSTMSPAVQVTTPAKDTACTGVDIFPSDNAVVLISENPAGTTFCFTAGTHNLSAPIKPRANDTYIGESGAIVDGRNTITHAFYGRGGASNQRNVTIRGLVIQNFRTVYSNFHTRNTIKAGDNWTVENNEIRYNYDTGVHMGKGMILRNNHIHHNGRYGITGGPGIAQNIVIDGNEIAYNNTRALNWSHAGTAKVVGSSKGATGLTWTNNWIHHNNGHGLHHDYNVGPDIEIAFNRIESNEGNGIQHEASWGAEIHDNVAINNGKVYIDKSCAHGGQIRLLNSTNVNVYDNHVESTEGSNGICLTDLLGHITAPASITINNVKITGNTIKLIRNAQTGIVGPDADAYNLGKNFFDLNTYSVLDPDNGVNWTWYITRADWQAQGQDSGSTFRAW